MCLYPKLIKNKKYTENKKNGGIIPAINDIRTLLVAVGCKKCMECKKQKKREWQVRLLEDIKTNKNGKFITLTFSNDSIKEINKTIEKLEGYDRDNEIATKAVRWWLERWRKKNKKSVRHWLITELGHNGTENIHIHGIIWTNKNKEEIENTWKYGHVWEGTYVNERTVNYIIKYVNKVDEKHPNYESKILTSAGIGNNYTKTINAEKNKYNENKTNETYRTDTGHKIAMPIYWRNKIYTDEEKEKLWIEKLNKKTRYINGEKIDISKGNTEYYETLKYYRKQNIELGYGTDEKNWNKIEYEKQRRIINMEKRINKNCSAGDFVEKYS